MSRDPDLAAGLAKFVAEDVGELLDEVRREGKSLARQRLVDAYADALVRAVAQRGAESTAPASMAAPESSTSATMGCYLYAVVDGEGASAATGEVGIQPGGGVDSVCAGPSWISSETRFRSSSCAQTRLERSRSMVWRWPAVCS